MNHYQPPRSNFISVTWQNGKLAFRIDLQRGLIEMQERGVKEVFDLASIVEKAERETVENEKSVL